MEPGIFGTGQASRTTAGCRLERYSIASPNNLAYSFANDAIVTPKPWPMPGLRRSKAAVDHWEVASLISWRDGVRFPALLPNPSGLRLRGRGWSKVEPGPTET